MMKKIYNFLTPLNCFLLQYAFERFESVPGLYPVMPDGAMYMMVGLDRKAFPEFANCLKIVEGMVREQSVFCLPGKCFGINDFFRVVLTGTLN